MSPDRSLDLDGAQRLAAHLIDNGSDGVVVAGSTGESATLSHHETLELFSAVVKAVGDRATVIAGCGKNDTAATVELTREASERGVDGILLVSPYYNRPSQRGLLTHFSTAAAATDLPVMLYDIPSRCAIEIAGETLVRLAEAVPNILAVKDAAGNFAKSSWVAANAPDGFEIFSGDDANLLPLLAVGGVGIVSVAAHLVGTELAEMVEVFPTDPARARRIHHRLLPLFSALFCDSNPVPLKAALALLGLPGGPVRPPLADADEAGIQRMRETIEALGLSGALHG